MKRKVIKLGSNSLLVSLPSSWVKKHGVKKGDEIVLEEKDNRLLVSSGSAPQGTQASIDVTNLKPILRRALGALYKKGYDEFTVHFADRDELELAHQTVREAFTGFEVVQHGKNHLVVREISQPHADQFEAVLRRQFLVIKDFAAEIGSALAANDPAWLERLLIRDKDVNKLADFCRRLINKQQSATFASALYCIVEQLEKISDSFRDISAIVAAKRIKPSQRFLQEYARAADYFEKFYHCFYQFSLPTMSDFASERRALRTSLEKAQERAQRTEQKLFFILEDIVEKVFDLNGPLMVLRL